MRLRFGSLFSGVEAASLAWEPLGMEAVFFAEVDPFCCELLRQRWPSVPNLGDVTAADFAARAKALGPIDILIGGSPCQSFSTAGKRKGLDDSRGDLTLRFWELAAEIGPQWVCWENVPGVLSQDGGRAFGTVVGKVAEQWQRFAWKVVDAQYAGVPQRRRRVFLVASAGAGSPDAVLLEPDGEGRDSAAGGEAGAGTAAAAEAGTGAVAKAFGGGNCSGEIGVSTTTTRTGLRLDFDTDTFVVEPQVTNAVAFRDERGRDCGDRSLDEQTFPLHRAKGPSEQQVVAYQCHGSNVGPMSTLRAGNGNTAGGVPFVATCVTGDHTHALTAEGFDASEDGTGRGQPIVAFTTKDDGRDAGDTAPTLRSMNFDQSHLNGGGQVGVAMAIRERGRDDGRNLEAQEELAYALTNPGSGGRADSRQVVTPQLIVRRLTPRECERLQGMPDDWTLVTFKKKPASDSVRYKAIGNSMAVPVIRQIGERIQREAARVAADCGS